MPANPRTAGLLIALASAATFGMSGPFAKALLEGGWSPGAAVLLRVAGGALMLLPASVAAVRRRRPTRQDLRVIGMYGVVAVAGAQVAYFSAVGRLSVGVALLLEYLAPVLLVAYVWARDRVAPSARTVLGAGVSLIGLGLVVDVASGVALDAVGVAYGVAAAVCLATFFMLSTKVSDNLPPVLLAGGGLGVGSIVLALAGVLGVLPMAASTEPVQMMGRSISWLVPGLALALFCSALSYMTGIAAAVRLGARLASFVGLTEVVFAVLFAWLLLGELPGGIQLIGGLAILLGVALVQSDRGQPAAPVAVAVPVSDPV